MENKDIILFILVIIVLYLLFCDNRKNKKIQKLEEQFTATTSSSSDNNNAVALDAFIKGKIEKYFNDRKEIPITESIKNLGILAKALQKDNEVTVPGNLRVFGEIKVGNNQVPNREVSQFNIESDGRAVLYNNEGKIIRELFKIDSDNNLVFNKFKIDEDGMLFNNIGGKEMRFGSSHNGFKFGTTEINKNSIYVDRISTNSIHSGIVETSILRPKVEYDKGANKFILPKNIEKTVGDIVLQIKDASTRNGSEVNAKLIPHFLYIEGEGSGSAYPMCNYIFKKYYDDSGGKYNLVLKTLYPSYKARYGCSADETKIMGLVSDLDKKEVVRDFTED